MGSAHPVEAQVARYENALVHERPDHPPVVEISFQAALDASQARVILVPDDSLLDGGGGRVNPFLELKRECDEMRRVACIEHIHVHQMKNSTGCEMTLRIDNLFSMPPDHRFESGVPRDPRQVVEDRPHPDTTNELVFTVPANHGKFNAQGIRVYKKRVSDGNYERWAGMDYALQNPSPPPPSEDCEGEDEDAKQRPSESGSSEFEIFYENHPFMRALRMYKTSLRLTDQSWTTKKDAKGRLVNKVPREVVKAVRQKMYTTFLAHRRYTTFHASRVSIDVDPDLQTQLNDRWLDHLRNNPSAPRPIVQIIMSLTMLTFGEGEELVNIIKVAIYSSSSSKTTRTTPLTGRGAGAGVEASGTFVQVPSSLSLAHIGVSAAAATGTGAWLCVTTGGTSLTRVPNTSWVTCIPRMSAPFPEMAYQWLSFLSPSSRIKLSIVSNPRYRNSPRVQDRSGSAPNGRADWIPCWS